MLRARIIPCLLLSGDCLVKTKKFLDPVYVGDALNAVRIFNEKEVDELIVLDIDATKQSREPAYYLIEQIAAECRAPLTYGGGVNNLDQISKVIGLGVEKVAVSAAAIDDPGLISSAAERIGSQSLTVVLDVRHHVNEGYVTYTHNGQKKTGICPQQLAHQMEVAGAGEIVINHIDRDGTREGYDFTLVELMRTACSVPITILGGAGSLEDLTELIANYPIIGASAGSLFVFKGKYNAVLINYPDKQKKLNLLPSKYSD